MPLKYLMFAMAIQLILAHITRGSQTYCIHGTYSCLLLKNNYEQNFDLHLYRLCINGFHCFEKKIRVFMMEK